MPHTKKKEHDLLTAVREMAEHRRGKKTLSSRPLLTSDSLDVAAIRTHLGYTQKHFSEHFGFSLSTLKNWERGYRKPERATRLLLAIIATHPKVVEKTLKEFSS